MSKIILISLFFTTLLNAQNVYKKIPENKIDSNRLNISKNFISEYLQKCVNKDYSEFKDFKLSKRMELFIKNEYKKLVMKKLKFNSSYIHKYTINSDPLELFIYEIKTKKLPKIKYLSVWKFQDKNYINGIWISQEKPLKRKNNYEKICNSNFTRN